MNGWIFEKRNIVLLERYVTPQGCHWGHVELATRPVRRFTGCSRHITVTGRSASKPVFVREPSDQRRNNAERVIGISTTRRGVVASDAVAYRPFRFRTFGES